MSGLEARIADVLEEHRLYGLSEGLGTDCVCGWESPSLGIDNDALRAHQAAMLAPVIAKHTRAERADELLKAAGDVFDTAIPAEVARWLETRAKALTAPVTGPDCQANKHPACDGRALDEATDEITRCQCACHP